MSAAETIGVLGAGLMGSGIAQLAAQSGARTLVHDPVPEALAAGIEKIHKALDRNVEKGRMTAEEAEAVKGRLEPAADMEALADCTLVIEAAPEKLALKLEIFERLTAVIADDAVIATNTSSLSVTEIAAGVKQPERVVGMHFFNPPPLMKLLEVVSGTASSDAALAVARATGEAMGKHVIDAADVAGFLVNRVNRPFPLESLKLLEERLGTVEQIDRILRMSAGFRMGAFELMDLVGIDTNHAVAVIMQQSSFGEPRYRPSHLAARKIAAGTIGRKSGSGWYEYPEGRPADPEPPAAGGGDGRTVEIMGQGPIASALASAAEAAGWTVFDDVEDAYLHVSCELGDVDGDHRLHLLTDASLHERDAEGAGFFVLAPLGTLAELTQTVDSDPETVERAEAFLGSLGLHVEHVGDAPGLVAGRVVCQLINEAAFLLGEGHGTPEDVDAGMTLGVAHPRGPVAWCNELGVQTVVDVLDALNLELGEPRYRVAPLLRQRLATTLEL
jgi:3-hydroxybutyryl-CoA dehydrogenase